MKNALLAMLLSLTVAPAAFATFETECMPDFAKEVNEREGVDKGSAKVRYTKIVKDVSRDKLCGMRYIYEVGYTYKSQRYKTNGYSLIVYSCNGCETIGDWVEFGN